MQNSSNLDWRVRKPTIHKVTHYAHETTFPWHQFSLSRRCTDSLRAQKHKTCYTIRPYSYKARKRKICWKAHFRCYLRLFAERMSNQDGLLRDQSVTKVTLSIRNSLWTTSAPLRMCTAVPRALHKTKSCSTLLPYKYTSGKQNTRQIALFRCYLKLCVRWTWNQDRMLSDRTVCNLMYWHKKFELSKMCTNQSRVL